MKPNTSKLRWADPIAALLLCLTALCLVGVPAQARDTDIYAVDAKQNCYILMDSSGSMAWPVYEHTIDYGAMYDYFYTLNDAPGYNYIYDPVSGAALFANHSTRQKIYLLLGDPSLTIATADGRNIAFTGDPGNPSVNWTTVVDTHTLVDADGNLSDDGTGQRRITVDTDGYILLDGARLPIGMDIKLHDFVTLYNGTVVDNGFGGVINAPGFYFSGYEGIDTTIPYTNNVAESGDSNLYFFVTGNWINMQAVYNLEYGVNPPNPAGSGDPAWKYEPFPIGTGSWAKVNHNLDYPNGGANYANNLTEATTAQSIVHPGAVKMMVHFSMFDVQGNGNVNTFTKDYVKIYDSTGALVAQYDNDNDPADGWSPIITGDTAVLKLKSDGNTTRAGYTIDKIAVVYQADAGGATYLMQSRLDVAKDAMLYVVEEFRGKMNWGFASFGNNATGAQIGPFLNPTEQDDTQRSAIAQAVQNVSASGGTPLMEALQDVFEDGYYGRRNILDDMLCRKNYVISMTDGFPSADDDNTRIAGVTFSDWDNDNWTQDPSQYASPAEDYYDDVAHWMYTHSWLDKSAVADPANSYVNVVTHHISFGANHPLLRDAADESGGEYITAYNKEQLVAAFYSLALMMSQAVSFTAPVVSVDAVNKIQSGDDLYMGLFLPKASTAWVGNVKKFKMGDGSAARPNLWMIYDGANQEAIDNTGAFVDNTHAFWGDDNDVNDSDNYGGADILEDGAGEVLLEDVRGFFAATTYWNRPIYTYKGGVMTKFDQANITAADLGVADAAARNKLVNHTHGYTHDADAATGAPLAVREWVLGPIIHSRPVVVDYYDTTQASLPLQKRLVVVGSNDGMLHVFDDTTGREVFAFIPDDILPKLKDVQANPVWDTVDGPITLYRRDKNPKYLIFGERRGGQYYWSLDVSNQDPLQWTVAWKYNNAELAQSWAEVKLASIPVSIAADGTKTYKDVAIFTGGYDAEEDNYPEPFNDADMSGSPYRANGTIDNAEWSQADASQDVYNNNLYDEYNLGMNESGRGIFVVDIDDPAAVTAGILPFSATYGAVQLATGTSQTFPDMKFCIPAGVSLAVGTETYTYTSGGTPTTGVRSNVLLSLYTVDVYGTLFKVRYDLEASNPLNRWQVTKVFSANPGSLSGSGRMRMGADTSDQGRKAFYPPAISWGGSGTLFDSGNYSFNYTTFSGRDTLASLFFGTGDREHPRYRMIRNRFYAIYDDTSVSAKEYESDGTTFRRNVAVSSYPYTEDKLLNVTCDELGENSVINNCYLGALNGACDPAHIDTSMKTYLMGLLKDNATYDTNADPNVTTLALEDGAAHENDAKGWYIILEDQGSSSVCSHVSYVASVDNTAIGDRDNHQGEHVLSTPALYARALYFTTYQPAASDVCNPQQGNGFAYSLNYLTGGAALSLNSANGDVLDLTDRYGKYTGIFGIPSGFTIVTREGEAAAMASMGGAIVGGGEGPGPGYKIPGTVQGLELYYWRLGNSQQP
ncbi:MAG: hypothetical protein ACOY3Z_01000 [Thermodesulfobacteriota bacterium]